MFLKKNRKIKKNAVNNLYFIIGGKLYSYSLNVTILIILK